MGSAYRSWCLALALALALSLAGQIAGCRSPASDSVDAGRATVAAVASLGAATAPPSAHAAPPFAGFTPLDGGFYRAPDGGLALQTRGINADGSATHAFLRAVPDIDLASYRHLDDGYYSRDAERVYVEHVMSDGTHVWLLEGAEADSFVVFGYRWAKDRRHVYHGGLRLDGADPKSLGVVSGQDARFFDYVSDADQVFFRSERIVGASPASFALLGGAYARDARHVYHQAETVAGADPASFELLGRGYGRDRSHVFFGSQRLQGAERASFEVLDGEAEHARDARWSYRWELRLRPR